ncbi:effector-binding domain-containing protein [Rhodococcus sp. OK519]|uniref:GyrI-like domain-containing protein n=1 Tax=Rhodococcus sp. OK519 TaxID=2135729 RepID=UPI000D3B86D9|nr:effector-binding domain-containing protein [Rhodococcus sp. OK519]
MNYHIRLEERDEQPAAAVCGDVPVEDIAGFIGGAFRQVVAAAEESGIRLAGPPFARYRPLPGGSWNIEAGFPLTRAIETTGRVEPTSLPAGPAVTTLHVGAYDSVEPAYIALTSWITEHGFVTVGEAWECYLDDPDVADPRTEIVMPVVRPDANLN